MLNLPADIVAAGMENTSEAELLLDFILHVCSTVFFFLLNLVQFTSFSSWRKVASQIPVFKMQRERPES